MIQNFDEGPLIEFAPAIGECSSHDTPLLYFGRAIRARQGALLSLFTFLRKASLARSSLGFRPNKAKRHRPPAGWELVRPPASDDGFAELCLNG